MGRKTCLGVFALAVLAVICPQGAGDEARTGQPPAVSASEGQSAPEESEFRRTRPPEIDTVVPPSQAGETAPGEEQGASRPEPAQTDAPANKAAPGAPGAPAETPEYWDSFQNAWDKSDREDAAAGTGEEGPRQVLQTNPGMLLLKMLMWLAVACGVIVLGGYAFRRWGKRAPLLSGAALGTVMGRLHLSPKATLYFVRTGGQVLVVGATQNHIGLIAQFPAEAYGEDGADQAAPREITREEAGSFLEYLRQTERGGKASSDAEVTSLQGDIQRLQEYLRETGREPKHG